MPTPYTPPDSTPVDPQDAEEAAALDRIERGRIAAELSQILTERAMANAPMAARSYKTRFNPALNPLRWVGLHSDTSAITAPDPATPAPPTVTPVTPEELALERSRFKGWAPPQ